MYVEQIKAIMCHDISSFTLKRTNLTKKDNKNTTAFPLSIYKYLC